jgi:hypothetical protein
MEAHVRSPRSAGSSRHRRPRDRASLN